MGVAWLMNRALAPATGHPVAFGLHPFLLAGAFAITLLIVLAAAWLPAERAARIEVREALRYE